MYRESAELAYNTAKLSPASKLEQLHLVLRENLSCQWAGKIGRKARAELAARANHFGGVQN